MFSGLKNTLPKVLKLLSGNAAYMLLPAAYNLLLSIWVVNGLGQIYWGQIVELQLYYYVLSIIAAWGNKEELLVQFANSPASITLNWQKSFNSRLLLLLPPLVLLGAVFEPQPMFHIGLWIVSRYVSQSVESIVTYQRRYFWPVVAELLPFGLTAVMIWYKPTVDIGNVLVILTLAHASRAVVVAWVYQAFFKGLWRVKPELGKLYKSLPFALITVLGVWQAKADLWCLDLLVSKIQLAQYQVFTGFMLLASGIPNLLLVPYSKTIYSLSDKRIAALKQQLVWLGWLISGFSVLVMWVVLPWWYKINYPLFYFVCAFFILLLPYYYALDVFMLYKQQQQKRQMIYLLGALLTIIVVCFITIPVFDIAGAIIANLLAQLVMFTLIKYKS